MYSPQRQIGRDPAFGLRGTGLRGMGLRGTPSDAQIAAQVATDLTTLQPASNVSAPTITQWMQANPAIAIGGGLLLLVLIMREHRYRR